MLLIADASRRRYGSMAAQQGSSLGAARQSADIGWRRAVALAERAVEIGQVAEAAGKCDRADRVDGMARIAQHAVRALQPVRKDELGERRLLVGEQHAQIARCDALPLGDD